MQLAIKVLEDKSTLLQIQKEAPESENALKAPVGHLVSMFAVQPSNDIVDAAKNLHRVTNQPGVQLIRQIFPIEPSSLKNGKTETSYTALMILVRVYLKFQLRSEKLLPVIVREARRQFVRRRSMVYTILEASGCKVTLITGENLITIHLHGEKIVEGITVFKGVKGFHSKMIEPFLKLDRVPSRHFQDYAVPDLPVIHRVGSRMDNPAIPVGFPALTRGILLVCGSNNMETITAMQQLINSISEAGSIKRFFVIDTQNELNGLITHLQAKTPRNLKTQVFRLGTNIHLNLCDVIIPLSPGGEIQEATASAAWKSHLVSQILLRSLNTSEYLTARYAIPLESQIRKTAEKSHTFTLHDVTLSLGGVNEQNSQENAEDANLMFSDMMTIEALIGFLSQFRSFPEVNYPSFTGHYSNTMVGEELITFFQFGAQPPLIRRATVGFLLHFLSQTMTDGCIVLTHTSELFGQQQSYKRDREIGSSSLLDACNSLAAQNVLILGSQHLQSLAVNLDTFDQIQNTIYLKMANKQDRETVFDQHELEFDQESKTYSKQQFLGIVEGEGLLFREDAPKNIGFHFKLKSHVPIDLNPIWIPKTKQRGSETLGLTPDKYEILMKLLKMLINQPCPVNEVMALIESTKQGGLSLDYFQSLGLYETKLDRGVTYWLITQKGRDYYTKQHNFVNSLPVPLTIKEVEHVQHELKRLESFYDISSSELDRIDINTKVKALVGRLLNYTRYLRTTSIPWMRIAEYHDLVMINTLEWQDFRNLFDLAHVLVNNLLLEIKELYKKHAEENIQESLQISSIPPSPRKKSLDDFLPAENFTLLQQLSQELELELYPNTGILDLHFALHTKGRSLFDELSEVKGKINK